MRSAIVRAWGTASGHAGDMRGRYAAHHDAASARDALPPSKFDYRSLELSADQIAAEAYKAQLGGGTAGWDRRGAFQLALLRHLGLSPQSSVLDVGCGPLRAGIHFLRFLAPGRYRGIDFNPSFVESAQQVMRQQGFAAQRARVSVLTDFDLRGLHERFDFVLCFSVLNHCSVAERARFFEQVLHATRGAALLVVTHAGWYADARPPRGFSLARSIGSDADLPPELALAQWSFDDVHGLPLPILIWRREDTGTPR
ncbi:MAG: class I SAM-dependent methyltransferase [Casimicrobiaceae bacterium]